MLTKYILGWNLEQWRAAFSEAGKPFDLLDCIRASWGLADRQLALMEEVQAAWCSRHVFDPLQSPILVPDGYRVRPPC